MLMDDFLFRGDLDSIDPDVAALIDLEMIRQARKLIMIPSESMAPAAVREAVGSVLGNIYAEGYPPEDWRTMSEVDLLDTDVRLAEYRRHGDPRYYKGVEIADMVESLAKHRTAERFANDKCSANNLFVNVQPLSGAPANNAVYTALAQPGDTIMGMDLLAGGHLTHGSPVNRSGLFFNVVAYGVREDNELLDYDQIRGLARQHKPKFIIGGYTSYPWPPDWVTLRDIATENGAYLLADVSHVAGLIIAGLYPSPVGIADVVSFTTHKTLTGPRGAVLITHDRKLARKLDRAVFPGEQGGPHVNAIAGIAVAMKLAGTEQFHELQRQTVKNAATMAQAFVENGLRVPYGGTNTHMLLLDVGKIKGDDGTPLSGDIAARMLDIAGVVANRNTIPGDKSPFKATGVRFGTTWITQRGFREAEVYKLTDAISDLLKGCKPFSYKRSGGRIDWRAKVNFDVFVSAQQRINALAMAAGIDYEVPSLDEYPKEADAAEEHFRVLPVDDLYKEEWDTIHVYGREAQHFLDTVLTSRVRDLGYGEYQPTFVLDANGVYYSRGILERMTDNVYLLHVEENLDLILQWLTALSDGYVQFSPVDLHAKVPGPVSVSPTPQDTLLQRFPDIDLSKDWMLEGIGIDPTKAYFVGCYGRSYQGPTDKALPVFEWNETENGDVKFTPVHDVHLKLGAKMAPFAGYDMPLWYDSVTAEHAATRQKAGIFDVTHMGVFEFTGQGADVFLNTVTVNDVAGLEIGEAHYSYLLGIDGKPLDDIFIYRLAHDNFMVVVNASNNDKNWAWLQGILNGEIRIDQNRPWAKAPMRDQVQMRDLRDPAVGKDRRVDIAVQGPTSLDLLLSLEGNYNDKAKLKSLKWSHIMRANLDGYDLLISRTGYTGERVAYEVFVHPDQAAAFFELMIQKGAVPAGLAARDSLRIEAGLPLYGHELAGHENMGPGEAGFAGYVKTWKPFFIGKLPYLESEAKRDVEIARFRIDVKGLRGPVPGDPVVDNRGRVVGVVTSAAVDIDGYQTGQVLIKDKFTEEGTPVMIYAHAAETKRGGGIESAKLGDRVTAPQAATILSRFPKAKKA